MAKEIRCSFCGEKCLDTDTYCRYCHKTINLQHNQNAQMLEGIELEQWKKFIDKKSYNYIEVFKKHEGKKFFIGLHPASFFPVLWMLYRKMYLQAVVTQVILYLCAFSLLFLWKIFPPLMFLSVPIMLAVVFAIGSIAHALYKSYCKRQLMRKPPNMQRGGTSATAAGIGYIIIGIITAVFFEPLSTLLIIALN